MSRGVVPPKPCFESVTDDELEALRDRSYQLDDPAPYQHTFEAEYWLNPGATDVNQAPQRLAGLKMSVPAIANVKKLLHNSGNMLQLGDPTDTLHSVSVIANGLRPGAVVKATVEQMGMSRQSRSGGSLGWRAARPANGNGFAIFRDMDTGYETYYLRRTEWLITELVTRGLGRALFPLTIDYAAPSYGATEGSDYNAAIKVTNVGLYGVDQLALNKGEQDETLPGPNAIRTVKVAEYFPNDPGQSGFFWPFSFKH